MEDKLFFILVYQKTHPLQTMPGLQCALSQPQCHYWIHRLLPVLQRALARLDVAPERDASRVATSPLALAGAPALALDGTERRRQRPGDAATQHEHYSGKKKTGYPLKAGQFACHRHDPKTSGMLAVKRRGARCMKPLRYIGVPP